MRELRPSRGEEAMTGIDVRKNGLACCRSCRCIHRHSVLIAANLPVLGAGHTYLVCEGKAHEQPCFEFVRVVPEGVHG